MRYQHQTRRFFALALAGLLSLTPILTSAQTRINLGKNKYSVQDDVKLGRDAAAEVERQMPILNDRRPMTTFRVSAKGWWRRSPLVFNSPRSTTRFKVVNASDINAFALPGGPMFINRGMIEASKNEGEMAGVMAHEISHVALRHATAQQTKQSSVGNTLGTLGLILGGAVLGGQAGAQAGAVAATAWQTKYSREYETQADILGAQIMADAGYDPHDLANMFQTIANQGGSRAPQWLSSHPDPGNRYQKINAEAALLQVSPNPIKITRDFSRIKERLSGMPRGRSMAEIEQGYGGGNGGGRQGANNSMAGGRYSSRVEYPSARTRVYSSSGISLSVPDNWREFSGSDRLSRPRRVWRPRHHKRHYDRCLSVARLGPGQRFSGILRGMLQNNSYLAEESGFSRTTVAGRQAYTTTLTGRSPVTNRDEVVTIYTLQLRNGDILYIAAVSPEAESYRYNTAFRNTIGSIRLND